MEPAVRKVLITFIRFIKNKPASRYKRIYQLKYAAVRISKRPFFFRYRNIVDAVYNNKYVSFYYRHPNVRTFVGDNLKLRITYF